jgi:hypothetical protein
MLLYHSTKNVNIQDLTPFLIKMNDWPLRRQNSKAESDGSAFFVFAKPDFSLSGTSPFWSQEVRKHLDPS